MVVLSHTTAADAHVLEAASRAILFVGAVWARLDFDILRSECVMIRTINLAMVTLRSEAAALVACTIKAACRAIICAATAVDCRGQFVFHIKDSLIML